MIVNHYVCDICKYDTVGVLYNYKLPMDNDYEKEVYLCKNCICDLNKYLTDKKNNSK